MGFLYGVVWNSLWSGKIKTSTHLTFTEKCHQQCGLSYIRAHFDQRCGRRTMDPHINRSDGSTWLVPHLHCSFCSYFNNTNSCWILKIKIDSCKASGSDQAQAQHSLCWPLRPGGAACSQGQHMAGGWEGAELLWAALSWRKHNPPLPSQVTAQKINPLPLQGNWQQKDHFSSPHVQERASAALCSRAHHASFISPIVHLAADISTCF